MAKITPSSRGKNERETVVVKTKNNIEGRQSYKWWNAGSKKDLAMELIETASFLKEQQQYRYRQAGVLARLYGNLPLFSLMGTSAKMGSNPQNLPLDRPTMNVVQSCVDTLVSRVTQSRPRPVFLTDNGDYKKRNMGKQLNTFANGELYQTKAYELAPLQLRDSCVLGTGILHVFEQDKRCAIERVLQTELLVDPNDSLYGDPRQLFRVKLVDRSMLSNIFPDHRSDIAKAEQAFPDNSADSARTISDQVMVVEGWHLPSGKNAGDGLHTLACTSGVIFSEEWKRPKFPFTFLHYSPRMLGFWGQGVAEQLMGTQVEINKLLITISQSINLVGVPRIFVEDGSKVVKAHLNNAIGSIVTYRGTKPQYEVAPCVPQEMYAQLQRLVEYAYQQSGVSALSAAAQKPAGLNSGEAIRNYDDLQSDRFAALVRRYDNSFIDLVEQELALAQEIAERDGKYTTVFPDKDGTREIDLPSIDLDRDSYVIQCFDSSALPRDPAGRLQKVTEMAQSGMIDMQEARRLLDYPDLQQVDKLANAAEERILKALDQIVESGTYTEPDPFMDLQMAKKLVVQYYNLHVPAKLEESKAEKLRTFSTQVDALIMQASQPAQPEQQAQPQAVPEAAPSSPLLPNAPGQ